MLTMTAVLIDTTKILPAQERKHLDIKLKENVWYMHKV
jgi:hypothetical protein